MDDRHRSWRGSTLDISRSRKLDSSRHSSGHCTSPSRRNYLPPSYPRSSSRPSPSYAPYKPHTSLQPLDPSRLRSPYRQYHSPHRSCSRSRGRRRRSRGDSRSRRPALSGRRHSSRRRSPAASTGSGGDGVGCSNGPGPTGLDSTAKRLPAAYCASTQASAPAPHRFRRPAESCTVDLDTCLSSQQPGPTARPTVRLHHLLEAVEDGPEAAGPGCSDTVVASHSGGLRKD